MVASPAETTPELIATSCGERETLSTPSTLPVTMAPQGSASSCPIPARLPETVIHSAVSLHLPTDLTCPFTSRASPADRERDSKLCRTPPTVAEFTSAVILAPLSP